MPQSTSRSSLSLSHSHHFAAMARSGILMFLMVLLVSCSGGGNGVTGTSKNNAGLPVTASISGTVVDRNGTPVPGVTVTAYHNNDHTSVTATTDAHGAYAIAGLPTGAWTDFTVYARKAGFAFYPSTGADGRVGRQDFDGDYRTVVRFLTLPTHDVTASFTAFRPGDREASLPRTGQTTSYAAGDDFSVAAGIAWPATRFSDNLDGTVTDHLTGLVWLKNAGCFTPSDWSSALTAANNLASGACGLADGSAKGDWRMPNVNELESLVDVSQVNPAVSVASPFININLAAAYWSSTTYAPVSSYALAIRFSDGRWINGSNNGFDNTKATAANALWAVKSGAAGTVSLLATGAFSGQGGGSGVSFGAGDDPSLQIGIPLTDPRFVDKGDGTVADTVTGLTWLKQADCINDTWSGTLSAVNSLTSGQCGLTDGSTAGQWRVPNRNEMLSLADRAPTFQIASYLNGIAGPDMVTVTGPVFFKSFRISSYYWTSTTSAADTTRAWTVYSCDFGAYDQPKSGTGYALAVR
ncbi:Lcl domain-containing protein [Geomesophilobacter sediminis]|uniref:DUF1566 domain-containing protein n=1 Tax=Geomesophilobacter sediminis TaxID=2798584 RepID=A0A8J7M0W5_9BACT|nr:DUF1566 domain-containing protein [Geomesophilobacter sediminis]MBJ6726553.1 DUF1566 domain-containing protein [Geomesophilobacter sediminis]